jgi:hypothetical protein
MKAKNCMVNPYHIGLILVIKFSTAYGRSDLSLATLFSQHHSCRFLIRIGGSTTDGGAGSCRAGCFASAGSIPVAPAPIPLVASFSLLLNFLVFY